MRYLRRRRVGVIFSLDGSRLDDVVTVGEVFGGDDGTWWAVVGIVMVAKLVELTRRHAARTALCNCIVVALAMEGVG
jgi:hypothetical protein